MGFVFVSFILLVDERSFETYASIYYMTMNVVCCDACVLWNSMSFILLTRLKLHHLSWAF